MTSFPTPAAWRPADLARVIALTAAALAQIASTWAPRLLDGAIDVPAQAARVEHALTPATYAFAIWGPIYAGALALTAWHLLPRHWGHPLARRIGWLAAGMFLVNAAWQVLVPLRGLGWPSSLLLAVEPVLGMALVLRLRGLGALTRVQRWLVAAPLQVLTGWVLAASFVGLSSSALWSGGWPVDTRELGPAVVLLVVAILACAAAAWASAALPLALAVTWALAAIVVRNLSGPGEPVLAIVAGAGVALVLAAWRWGARAGVSAPALAPG